MSGRFSVYSQKFSRAFKNVLVQNRLPIGRGRELDRKAGGRIDSKVFEGTGLCFTAVD